MLFCVLEICAARSRRGCVSLGFRNRRLAKSPILGASLFFICYFLGRLIAGAGGPRISDVRKSGPVSDAGDLGSLCEASYHGHFFGGICCRWIGGGLIAVACRRSALVFRLVGRDC